LSDELIIRITANPGESFLDKMIALVEGASRQKTPNEIALTIVLAGLTWIFLLVIITLNALAGYSGILVSTTTLIALLVCLIPTTIGGLLSAIGIAGMDRVTQFNVIAKSGKAVEAAGDINTQRNSSRLATRAAERSRRQRFSPQRVMRPPKAGQL
jgi:K+-transporting ATPase ATPase B chain